MLAFRAWTHSKRSLPPCPRLNFTFIWLVPRQWRPLRRMTEAGLFVTLNSDDPPMFGTSLSNEYLVTGRDLGFSPAELAGLAANGVRASFLDAPAKDALLAEIAAVPLPGG